MPGGRALCPESELLLWCIRESIDASGHPSPSFDLSNLNWAYVVNVARQAGIAPLIFDSLDPIARRLATSQALNVLRRHRSANIVATVFRSAELALVLGAYQQHGIQTIVLKGSALAETVYARRIFRPMGDIDLLVRESDVPRAEEVLVHLGYGFSRQETPEAQAYHVEYQKEGAVPIEIHWDLENRSAPVKFDLDGIWKRAVPASVAGCATLVMAPEDSLLHLCGHAGHHHKLKRALQGLCDINLTIRHYGSGLDWDAVRQRSQRFNLDKYTHLTLWLSRELLHTPVPNSILAALRPDDLPPRVLEEAARTVVEGYVDPPVTSTFVRFWSSRNLSERARALAQSLSLDSVASRYSLPRGSARAYLRYPWRLADLVGHYGPVVTRLWLRDRQSRAMMERERDLLIFADWLGS